MKYKLGDKIHLNRDLGIRYPSYMTVSIKNTNPIYIIRRIDPVFDEYSIHNIEDKQLRSYWISGREIKGLVNNNRKLYAQLL